jgi:thymidylate kinase
MFSVALVGGDGAGKTTVAERLGASLPFPTKYLYMGLSTHSGNLALPTTRLVRYLKVRAHRKAAEEAGVVPAKVVSSHDLHYGEDVERGTLWKAARLLNRLAEAWYRQLLSLGYQWRGNVVIYDRHFLFETAPSMAGGQVKEQPPLDRLEHWMVHHLYPRPSLVVFLDAPAEVLYQRKREATPAYLERRRKVVLDLGKTLPNFVRVDAAQPLDQVVADVTRSIVEFDESRSRRA